jgi:protein-tyrosine-phosphatase
MAETIARAKADAFGVQDMVFRSAGVFATPGAPASDGARLAAKRHGFSLDAHEAALVSPELLNWADLVLTMGMSHLELLSADPVGSPAGNEPLKTLLGTAAIRGPVDPTVMDPQVPDPFGGSDAVYLETWRVLEGLIDQALKGLSKAQRGTL